jgi:hypothetical protein
MQVERKTSASRWLTSRALRSKEVCIDLGEWVSDKDNEWNLGGINPFNGAVCY